MFHGAYTIFYEVGGIDMNEHVRDIVIIGAGPVGLFTASTVGYAKLMYK